jgi:hypothetical protein
VGPSLAPLRLAVGVLGEAQVTGHALSAGIAADPGCVTVQLDWNNVNSLSRQQMLDAVAERAPALMSLVIWAYHWLHSGLHV